MIRVRTFVIPGHKVVENKGGNKHLEISRLKGIFTVASVRSVPSVEFKVLRPTCTGRMAIPLAASAQAARFLKVPADLNNMEATQREVKLEVAGR